MKTVNRALSPIHSSAFKFRMRARDMTELRMESDQRETCERIALGIFTDMSNAGASLQTTLAAIYVSGLQHATEFSKTKAIP